MQKKSLFLMTIIAFSMIMVSVPGETSAAPVLLMETFDSGIPATWSQIQYSGTGVWEVRGDTRYPPPNTDGSFATADSDSNVSDVYDVGLFTPSLDMTGLASVSLYVDRNFQDFAGDGEAHIATYSGGTTLADQEEVLWYSTEDDPSDGVEFSATFNPSVYSDPSDVYVEFWYSTEGGTWAWSFSIDNVVIEGMTQASPVVAFTPIKNSNLALANAMLADIQGQLPEDVPSGVMDILAQIELHIANTSGTSNAIYANNELRLAMELMEEALSQI